MISGANASTYTINSAQLSHAGFYYVEVINLVGSALSRVATLTVLVSNDVPVAKNDAYTTPEDVPLTIPATGILVNDVDIYPGALTALLVSNPGQGSLSLNTNGSFTYNSDPNFSGSDSFTYRVKDGGTTIWEQNAIGGSKQEIDRETAAQSFRHGTAGESAYSIKKVVIRLSKKSGRTQNLNFSIGTGQNSGALAGSSYTITMASITNNTEGASFQNYNIDFNTPVGPLTAGTTYYLNFENVSTSGKEVYVEHSSSDVYPRGIFYLDGSNSGEDMRFEIHEETFSSIATVTLNVTPVYDSPVVVNDSTNTLEDTSVTVKVLVNDSSPDGLPLTITGASTTNGTAIVNGTNIIFTPSPNFYGTALFNYTISDGTSSATADVTVNIAPVSDYPPVAIGETCSTAEDTSLTISAPGVLANDIDGDGEPITALLVSNVSNGTVSLNSNGSFTYIPSTNFNGTDSFTYRATDGTHTGNVATVTINVTPVNDPPCAVNDSTNALEDVSVSIRVLANDSDLEGNPFSLISASTTNGTAVVSGTNVVFTPSTNYNGSVVFSYTISDGTNSATANVMVTVIPVNDVPAANNDNTNALEDVSVTIRVLANDTDVEGAALTITSTSTTNGTAVISGTNIIFRASTNYNGPVVFSYAISDGTNLANATVTVTVAPVNDAPVAVNDTASTLEDVSVTIGVLANDTDVEGNSLTLASASTTNGTAVISGTNVVFTPATNYNGSVTFSYTISDGSNSATANVTVGVSPTDDPPVAVNDTATTAEDASVTIKVLVNDKEFDGSPLTITAASTTNGTAVISGTNIVFRASTNYNGTVVFSYTISDGISSASANATVTVTPVNDAPVAADDNYTATEDVPLIISSTAGVLTNDFDVDGNPLRAYVVSDVSNGTLTLNTNGGFTYSPDTNFNGSDSFTYGPWDGAAGDVATVTINIAPVNDAPIAVNDSATTAEDTSVTIKVLLNDTDPDGSLLTITATFITNGIAVISGTNVIFTPSANFNGTASFNYTISDSVYSATGKVTVTVTSVNDAPVANNDSTNTLEDVSVTIRVLANDTDVESTALTLSSAFTTNGTATISGTNIVFRSATNFNGTVGFSYVTTDGNKFATGSVTVAVGAVNDGPSTQNDSYATQEDVPLTIPAAGILSNDVDPDSNALTALLVSDVANGSLSLNPDGSFTYTPDRDYNGGDSFTYRTTDGLGTGNVATVNITLTPVVDLLRFVSQQRTTNGMKLELSGPSASIYVIQASTNLTNWTSIFTNFTTFGSLVCTDTWATNSSVCFYRAMIPAPTNLQQNVTGGTRVEIDPGLPGAQSFRHGTAGGAYYSISKIVIRISKDSPNPNGSLILSIGTGVNSGAVVGSTFAITPTSITNNTGGTSFQTYDIVFPEPVGPFTAGTTYYLNFVTQSTNGEEYWLERSSGSSTYSRGTFYSAGSDLGRDMKFEIWGQ